jgi:hypothetical protein
MLSGIFGVSKLETAQKPRIARMRRVRVLAHPRRQGGGVERGAIWCQGELRPPLFHLTQLMRHAAAMVRCIAGFQGSLRDM